MTQKTKIIVLDVLNEALNAHIRTYKFIEHQLGLPIPHRIATEPKEELEEALEESETYMKIYREAIAEVEIIVANESGNLL